MTNLRNSTAMFLLSEDGAVTVDWVVLTAALVGLGLAVMSVVSGGVENLSGDVSTELASLDISAVFGSGGSSWTPRIPEDQLGQPWPQYFSEDSFTDDALLSDIEDYAYAANAVSGENDYAYDHYWAAREEAERRGLAVPAVPTA